MERKHVILLTVIAVATLLTAMVGSTFAYFTAIVSGNNPAEKVVDVSTAEVTATYSEGSTIGVTNNNITPGWIGNKTITITNNDSVKDTDGDNVRVMDYTISFAKYNNDKFTNLKYVLTDYFDPDHLDGGEGADPKSQNSKNTDSYQNYLTLKQPVEEVPVEEPVVLNIGETFNGKVEEEEGVLVKGKLGPGESHTFLFKIIFVDSGADQKDEQGAKFSAQLVASAEAHMERTTP